jgi:hypothetical protein
MNEQIKNLIPLDKAWAIRMGFLDIVRGERNFIPQIEGRPDLNNDIEAMIKASKQWNNSDEIDVGESGTLFRYLQFASWKLDLNKEFIKHKTLLQRDMNTDSRVVDWSIDKLLELDFGTTQWASAAILLGATDEIPADNYFLQMSKEALEKYESGDYEARKDQTFLRQVETFLEILKSRATVEGVAENEIGSENQNESEGAPKHRSNIEFKMMHPDDYCFAQAFGFTNREEGARMWPALEGHESNRPEEMEIVLQQYKNGETIESNDHRVVQAVAMLSFVEKGSVSKEDFANPNCVAKSWPMFWDFIDFIS